MLDVHSHQGSQFDRRTHPSRDKLLQRVYGEFHEMPCLRLTAAQAQRLFGLRGDVCQRILGSLVAGGALICESQRYRLNDARSWPTERTSARASTH